MSYREFRACFERLRIRYVLHRWLGKGEGEYNACAFVRDPVIVDHRCDDIVRRVVEEMNRRDKVRGAVNALCDSVSAPRRNVR